MVCTYVDCYPDRVRSRALDVVTDDVPPELPQLHSTPASNAKYKVHLSCSVITSFNIYSFRDEWYTEASTR